MRRVLIVSPTATAGGSERAVSNLAHTLPAFGFEPIAVLLENGPLEAWLADAGCATEVIPAHPTRQLHRTAATLARLRRLIRDKRIDAVISNTSKGHVYGGIAASLSGVPGIWWQHGVANGSRIERVAGKVPASVIVCASNHALLAQRVATPRRKVQTINPGTDVEAVASHKGAGRSIREAVGWTDQPVVGIVGRLEPWKGQETFLRAAALVTRSHPRARYAVIGGAILGREGSYPDDLRQLAGELGISEHVLFSGHQLNVWDWVDALDVVVHTSFGEPFGLVVVEAMALGKPVVAAADGGPLEIVQEGVSGLLAPPGKHVEVAAAIATLLDNAQLRESLSIGAAQRAREFTVERMAAGFASTLNDALARAA